MIKSLKTAKSMDLKTIAFTGPYTSKVRRVTDCCVSVPSTSTPRIQELHITIAHILCELIEETLGDKKESTKDKNSLK